MSKSRVPNEIFIFDRITDIPLFEGFSAPDYGDSVFGRDDREGVLVKGDILNFK